MNIIWLYWTIEFSKYENNKNITLHANLVVREYFSR